MRCKLRFPLLQHMISISTRSMFPVPAPPSPADFDPFPVPPRTVRKGGFPAPHRPIDFWPCPSPLPRQSLQEYFCGIPLSYLVKLLFCVLPCSHYCHSLLYTEGCQQLSWRHHHRSASWQCSLWYAPGCPCCSPSLWGESLLAWIRFDLGNIILPRQNRSRHWVLKLDHHQLT